MIKGFCQRVLAVASAFLHIEKGSILIYTGAFMAVGVGGAALSIDVGRIVLLRTQMQNRADAGALGGAAQLDSLEGAVNRAEVVAGDSMLAWTTSIADQAGLVTWQVNIYDADPEDNITRRNITTDDNAARFVEVIMERRTLSFFYAPAMNILKGVDASKYTELGAYAVAMSDPFVCKAQPLMICNPFDDGDPLTDDPSPTDLEYVGRGLTLKASTHGDGTVAPGNFGMLALPSDEAGGGQNSAVAVFEALSAEEPDVCYGLNTLTTAPGAMMMSVIDAINTRFGRPWWVNTIIPAPNVVNYPKDWYHLSNASTFDAVSNGVGGWPKNYYWKNHHYLRHGNGTPVLNEDGEKIELHRPAVMGGDTTRYQMYLFELGMTFWKEQGSGSGFKRTSLVAVPGWTEVDPSDWPDVAYVPWEVNEQHTNEWDGVPHPAQTISSIYEQRRVLRVAVMECLEYDIKGKDTYPAAGEFLAIFLIRQSDPVYEGGGVYGEILGPVNEKLSLEFHGNVRLVE